MGTASSYTGGRIRLLTKAFGSKLNSFQGRRVWLNGDSSAWISYSSHFWITMSAEINPQPSGLKEYSVKPALIDFPGMIESSARDKPPWRHGDHHTTSRFSLIWTFHGSLPMMGQNGMKTSTGGLAGLFGST